MPDFKGRKDFPEVADNKIKIGDYSGSNRLSVTDIYSPKSEPELRDQMMAPVKGKTNNYDSPILSQQPVITLSDVESEAALIKAINGYIGKENHDNWTDVEAGFGTPRQKPERESHPSRVHDEGASPRQRRKPRRNVQAQDVQKQADSFSDVEAGFNTPRKKDPKESHPSLAHDKGAEPRQRRKPRRNPQAQDYQKSDFEKLGPGGMPVAQNPLKPAAETAGGAAPASPAFGQPRAGGAEDKRAAFQSPTGSAASQGTPPSAPPPLRQPTRPPSYRANQPRSGGGGYTAEQQRNAMNPRNTLTIPQIARQPAGGAGGPQNDTPGMGGEGVAGRAGGLLGRGLRGLGRGLGRGAKAAGRGIGEQIGAAGEAAKVGVQQGIRHGVEGAKEFGPEADARRAEQAGKVYRNPLTAAVASGARRAARLGGVKQVARGMGYGKTSEEAQRFAGRHEYADDDDLTKEMMLSDILNELETYMSDQQPNNTKVEQQLTRGNISKMMRNTEDKAPKDWKYHV